MKKISISLSGHKTSISIEPEFITALNDIAARRGVSVASIISSIDNSRGTRNLSSAVRVWILENK